MKKEEAIEIVNDSHSSIFTKDDVIRIINGIENDNAINEDKINNIVGLIIHDIENGRFIDEDDCTFSIESDNRIVLEDAKLLIYDLEEVILYRLNDLLK
jgi:hypothetical protein